MLLHRNKTFDIRDTETPDGMNISEQESHPSPPRPAPPITSTPPIACGLPYPTATTALHIPHPCPTPAETAPYQRASCHIQQPQPWCDPRDDRTEPHERAMDSHAQAASDLASPHITVPTAYGPSSPDRPLAVRTAVEPVGEEVELSRQQLTAPRVERVFEMQRPE